MNMNSQTHSPSANFERKSGMSEDRDAALDSKTALLTPKETAAFLKASLSWLAKARMKGEGPPYIKFGRSVRYSAIAVQGWLKSRRRFSTND
jgi:predicted DNA-binding transcriptional regulator AlpA